MIQARIGPPRSISGRTRARAVAILRDNRAALLAHETLTAEELPWPKRGVRGGGVACVCAEATERWPTQSAGAAGSETAISVDSLQATVP
jgi:hypothetical protein